MVLLLLPSPAVRACTECAWGARRTGSWDSRTDVVALGPPAITRSDGAASVMSSMPLLAGDTRPLRCDDALPMSLVMSAVAADASGGSGSARSEVASSSACGTVADPRVGASCAAWSSAPASSANSSPAPAASGLLPAPSAPGTTSLGVEIGSPCPSTGGASTSPSPPSSSTLAKLVADVRCVPADSIRGSGPGPLNRCSPIAKACSRVGPLPDKRTDSGGRFPASLPPLLLLAAVTTGRAVGAAAAMAWPPPASSPTARGDGARPPKLPPSCTLLLSSELSTEPESESVA